MGTIQLIPGVKTSLTGLPKLKRDEGLFEGILGLWDFTNPWCLGGAEFNSGELPQGFQFPNLVTGGDPAIAATPLPGGIGPDGGIVLSGGTITPRVDFPAACRYPAASVEVATLFWIEQDAVQAIPSGTASIGGNADGSGSSIVFSIPQSAPTLLRTNVNGPTLGGVTALLGPSNRQQVVSSARVGTSNVYGQKYHNAAPVGGEVTVPKIGDGLYVPSTLPCIGHIPTHNVAGYRGKIFAAAFINVTALEAGDAGMTFEEYLTFDYEMRKL